MPTYMLGKEFTVIFDSSVVGVATDFDFTVNKSTVEVTTLASAGWKDNAVIDKDWAINFNGLVARATGDSSRGYSYTMDSIITSNASTLVAIKPSVESQSYWEGGAFLTSVKMSGGVGDKVTYSGTALGTGPLSKKTS